MNERCVLAIVLFFTSCCCVTEVSANPELILKLDNLLRFENDISPPPDASKGSADASPITFSKPIDGNNAQEMNVHDNILHGFDYEDVTVPIRIHHESGEPYTHGKHFRMRRSARPEDEHNDLDIHHFVANYSFMAFGEEFKLHLTPKHDFIAPSYSLQTIGNMTSSEAEALEEMPRHCFYTGYINEDETHAAVVSLCGGLFGAFRTDQTDFIIQPVNHVTHGYDTYDVTEELATKPHKILRRSVAQEGKARELCAFTEKKVEHTKSRRAEPSTKHHPFSTDKDRKERGRSRSKRYLSYPRHVEVMVTADNLMYRTHGHNLHHYVLTLMAIVNHIYLDPSIENLVNIVLVRLIVITDDQYERGPRVTRNAHDCLHNFCQWQASQNDPDDTHPDHHDTAVLITRQDICRSATACDTLGLTDVGTMCHPSRSCSINEDNGLSTAFTIAHEIGHQFSAPHDNSEKCMTDGRLGEMHVMSPQLDHKAKPWSWSKCSAKFITNFLDYGNGQCLLDDPPQRVLPLPLEQPGQIFDVNSQCEFVYGKGVTQCGFMNTCGRLWCVSKHRRDGCRTPHMPWADGTKCGAGMWCQKGQCVSENKNTKPIHGSWGSWSSLGECSRKCGGGIRIAVRKCNDPVPQNGGKFCVGRRKKFRSCSWEECSTKRDIRAEQCSAFDNWSSGRHFGVRIRELTSNVRWIPKFDNIMPMDRCKLICQVKSRDQSTAPWYVLKLKVLNGTPCGPDTHDICVEGMCKKAGCDHVLNSSTREDDCGVCGGDNTGCTTIKGEYNVGNTEGYSKVVVFPVGATKILIQQSSYSGNADDNNFLALRDSRGHYILNGGKSIVQYAHRVYKRSNTDNDMAYDFDYSGTDNVVELINSTKAIQESITVEVLQAGELMPPNIRYKYNVPTRKQMAYHWDPFGPWSTCSRACQGSSKRKVLCMSADNDIVSESHCQERGKPTSVKKICNTQCEIRWHVERVECSSRCGSGREIKHTICVRASTLELGPDGHRKMETLPSTECLSPKPSDGAVCYGGCLPTRWEYDDWSECSHTCGGGFKTRKAICRDVRGYELSPQECQAYVRVVSQHCNNQPCPQWVTSDFSECSSTCGTSSVRSRRVWCRSPDRSVEPNHLCDSERKPASTVTCTVVPCPQWHYAEWQECSKTCGVGSIMRRVTCMDHTGASVDEDKCDAATKQTDIKDCVIERECLLRIHYRAPIMRSQNVAVVNRQSIPAGQSAYTINRGVWRTGDWTSCSATCGEGIQERYVSCRNRFEERDDCEGAMPPNSQRCNAVSCSVTEWQTSAWSDCSVTCGQGIMTRFVWCVHDNRNTHDDASCRAVANKPINTSTCLLKPCATTAPATTTTTTVAAPHYTGTWLHGDWTQCSSSCGPGTRRRAVECQSEGHCDPTTIPASTEPCEAVPCTRWSVSVWEQCTKTCGSGSQHRDVTCAMSDGTYTHDQHCEIMSRPVEFKPCNTDLCPEQLYRWKRTKWGSCSLTCGQGTKTRTVACVDRSLNAVDEENCSGLRQRKPRAVRKCRLQKRCPKWHTTNWGKCSTSCGEGNKRRIVACRYKRKSIQNEKCDLTMKPQEMSACSNNACPHHYWKTSLWERCSASCGNGYKSRIVSCMRSDGEKALSRMCTDTKPSERETCFIQHCPPTWTTGPWSQCSTTCGSGTQSRDVSCLHIDRETQQTFTSSLCTGRKPLSSRECNYNDCSSDIHWRVEPWSECSVTCGVGSSTRRVYCARKSTGGKIALTYCANTPSFQPDAQKACTMEPCLPTSCQDAKVHTGSRKDGEYQMLIHGIVSKIYCKNMNSPDPTEFLTLSGDEESYSEMYKYRLLDPTTCPVRDSRNVSYTAHSQAGRTVFHKVRIDIDKMKLISDDFSFATTEGIPTKVGVAGDCYSKVQCPQGSFRISLKNTGFSVADRTSWVSYGRDAARDIVRADDGSSVYGKCGGYCSRCQPDPATGLLLTPIRKT